MMCLAAELSLTQKTGYFCEKTGYFWSFFFLPTDIMILHQCHSCLRVNKPFIL